MKTSVETHAHNELEPLHAYHAADAIASLTIAIDTLEAKEVVGVYLNDERHFIVITATALHGYEDGTWLTLPYGNIYFVRYPFIEGAVDRHLQIIDKQGNTHRLAILGDTVRPKYTWESAEMDVWYVWSFLYRVCRELREEQARNEIHLNPLDFAAIAEMIEQDITMLVRLITRWQQFVIEAEQGYTLSVDDYNYTLWTRDILHRIGESLSVEGKAQLAKQISPADQFFLMVTRSAMYPLSGSAPEQWWWYRIPLRLVGSFKEDIAKWQNGSIIGSTFAEEE